MEHRQKDRCRKGGGAEKAGGAQKGARQKEAEAMTATGKRQPDPNVVQRQASDPAVSAWVTASAGTGKTQVLTDRTLRLMLGGAQPGQILCLTFTRAAASVMTNRIRDTLGVWASCDQSTLEEKLRRLTGKKPDAKTVARARQLFAEFIDSGEMRIQTIHSFAQSLLKRFPIESGIPPYFDVMDEQSVAEELRVAQAEVLQQSGLAPSSELARAIGLVTPSVGEDDFTDLIGNLAERRGQLMSIFRENGGLEGAIAAVHKYLGAPQNITPENMLAALNADGGLDGRAPDIAGLKRAAATLAQGTAAEKQKAEVLEAWLAHPDKRVLFFDEYKKLFLTTEGTVRQRLTTKATAAAEDALQAEAARLAAGQEALKTLGVAQQTAAILRMSDAILQNYEKKKRALNLLDYDDLIYQAGKMMERDDHAASWVLQKLPGDLKHVLIDEGQDTNPDQWKLVSAIVKEFFAAPRGAKGAAKKDRTVFVVGDEKQSIFSFQQANPAEFAAHKKEFADLVKKSGGTWRDVEMQIAFRSSPAITQAVDAVFANPAASDGLFHPDDAERKVAHDPFRRGQAGLVEVHPITEPEESPERTPWELPLKMEAARDPAVDLADKIADRIKGWLDSGEKLEARDRPVSPGDIIILVRRRSAFVDHMVRALKKRNVPVAGADRISLHEQIAVMDLVALGETILFPKDEYKLACVLKSPLIGMTDKQLEDLAIDRAENLWNTLKKKAEDPKADKIYAAAYQYLDGLRNRVGTERPYELYSTILLSACPATGKSGLTSIYGRLGYEAEDPIVEFMNALEQFEKVRVPDLRGFLSWLAAGESDVKREVNIGPENQRVHIMTVHGAKGLEAPIVILPDTVGVPADNPRARPKFLWPEGGRKVPLWAPRADMENAVFTRERKLAEAERDREFRRLLYVAMTRAADRLYVYGERVPDKNFEQSWYHLIRTGLAEHAKNKIETVPVANDNADKGAAESPDAGQTVLRLSVKQTAKPVPDNIRPPEKDSVVGIPVWARTIPPAGEGTQGRFRPSQQGEKANDNAAPAPRGDGSDREYYMNLGTAVHALLELLPPLPPAERDAAAREYLSDPSLGISDDDRKSTLKQVSAILDDPQFGALFGPRSRAEVSISGTVEKDGKKQMLNALIDRLVVEDDSVLIVDYKNNFAVPKDASEVTPEYVMQLAAYKMAVQQIYPDKKVKCALLYTRAAKLIPLPDDKLAAAIKAMKLKNVPPQAAQKKSGPKI
ncbi:MAG: double-strand break repair helicase AddA [Alphaproteobacteria bacterium]|nr:double-strand break repair helicase AddA [Alphaproteobacteria bacterium]